MLGHVELGLRIIAEHAPQALEGERRLALEHCVLLHHGPEASAGRRFASAEALALYPPQRPRRAGQGRVRARRGLALDRLTGQDGLRRCR